MQAEELESVFRSNLRNRRIECGLTQADVARLSGIPQPHISAFERGTKAPTVGTVARLAEALACPPSALFSLEAAELAEKNLQNCR